MTSDDPEGHNLQNLLTSGGQKIKSMKINFFVDSKGVKTGQKEVSEWNQSTKKTYDLIPHITCFQ